MQNKGLGLGVGIVLAFAVVLFLAAQPANVIGVPNTVTSVAIDTSSSGDQQIVAQSGSNAIYVTYYSVFASGTTNVSWDYGTGSNCVSGRTEIVGVMAFIAQTGISAGSGLGAVIYVPNGNALCINNSNAVQVGGVLSYQYAQ